MREVYSRVLYFLFVVCAIQGLVLADSFAQDKTSEIMGGKNRSKGGDRESRQTVGAQSGCAAPIDTDNSGKGVGGEKFQSSAQYVVDGVSFAGTYLNLSTETAIQAACSSAQSSGASPESIKYMCQDRKKAAKAFDVAAKRFGVPAVVIACIEAQRHAKDDDSGGGSDPQDSRTAEQQTADDKAKEEAKKKDFKEYQRLKNGCSGGGGGGGDGEAKRSEEDEAFDTAFEIFWMNKTVAAKEKEKLKSQDASEREGAYWALVRFAVNAVFANWEAAKQSLGSSSSQGSGSAQKAFAGVKKCIEAARAEHDKKSK